MFSNAKDSCLRGLAEELRGLEKEHGLALAKVMDSFSLSKDS